MSRAARRDLRSVPGDTEPVGYRLVRRAGDDTGAVRAFVRTAHEVAGATA
ncbi:hypothetical protein HW130_34255 [Streptomyces sp. PKU-EA00015]|nr:hypothetical protein [Streptomyces sp. PKU-EA00015]NWF31233.1 hypothetical protein [Streptomyces sp. PKU-EA00015]